LDRERKSHEPRKGGKRTQEEEEAFTEGMSSAAGLFTNPSATYFFRLVETGTVNSTAGATLSYYHSFSPAIFSEHTAYLKYLFQEVRVRSSKLTIIPVAVEPNSSGYYPAFGISSTLKYVGTLPSNIGEVIDEADSEIRASNGGWNAPSTLTFIRHVPGDMNFDSVDTPASQVGYGGWGQWWVAGVSNFAANKAIYSYMLENVYEYRARD